MDGKGTLLHHHKLGGAPVGVVEVVGGAVEGVVAPLGAHPPERAQSKAGSCPPSHGTVGEGRHEGERTPSPHPWNTIYVAIYNGNNT